MIVIFTDYCCLQQCSCCYCCCHCCYHYHLQQTSEGKPTKCKESVSAVESDVTPASTVASSIFESVVFSGNIVKNIHTGEEDESVAERSEASLVPNNTLAHGELGCCASDLSLQVRWRAHTHTEETGSKRSVSCSVKLRLHEIAL